MSDYILRPATADDYDELWRLHVAAMREYVAATWGWDERFQSSYVGDHFDVETLQVIEQRGGTVGLLSVERRPEAFLSTIELDPSVQREGVGTAILKDLLRETDQPGVPVGPRVLKVNPALRFYERLGFGVVAETATHFVMARPQR